LLSEHVQHYLTQVCASPESGVPDRDRAGGHYLPGAGIHGQGQPRRAPPITWAIRHHQEGPNQLRHVIQLIVWKIFNVF